MLENKFSRAGEGGGVAGLAEFKAYSACKLSLTWSWGWAWQSSRKLSNSSNSYFFGKSFKMFFKKSLKQYKSRYVHFCFPLSVIMTFWSSWDIFCLPYPTILLKNVLVIGQFSYFHEFWKSLSIALQRSLRWSFKDQKPEMYIFFIFPCWLSLDIFWFSYQTIYGQKVT